MYLHHYTSLPYPPPNENYCGQNYILLFSVDTYYHQDYNRQQQTTWYKDDEYGISIIAPKFWFISFQKDVITHTHLQMGITSKSLSLVSLCEGA